MDCPRIWFHIIGNFLTGSSVIEYRTTAAYYLNF